MNIISVKQLRENFIDIRNKVEEGESFLLLYRSKPLAKIVPFEPKTLKKDDQIISNNIDKLRSLSGGIEIDVSTDPNSLNELINTEYDEMLS